MYDSVDFCYLLGSLLFVFGSFEALWMWKDNQFGLAMMPAMNHQKAQHAQEAQRQADMLAERPRCR